MAQLGAIMNTVSTIILIVSTVNPEYLPSPYKIHSAHPFLKSIYLRILNIYLFIVHSMYIASIATQEEEEEKTPRCIVLTLYGQICTVHM